MSLGTRPTARSLGVALTPQDLRALFVDQSAMLRQSALAHDFGLGNGGLYLHNLSGSQRDLGRSCVFLEVTAALGSGDGRDVLSLRQYPGEGELASRDVLPSGQRPDSFDEGEIVVYGLGKVV